MSNQPSTSGTPSVNVRSRKRDHKQLLDLVPETLEKGRRYKWVRCRADEHMQSVTNHKLTGYRLEQQKEGGVKTVVDPDEQPDKTIRIGDLVLMSISEDEARNIEHAEHMHTEGLLASTSAETERMAKEKGVSIIKDADHGR